MPLDGHSAAPNQSRGARALGWFALLFVAGLVALLVMARIVAFAAWGDGGYWAIGIAAAGVLALAAGMLRPFAMNPAIGGMALGANTLGAAFFLAIPGAIFAAGHDGLAYALGIGAGLLLLQLVVAPRFAASGAASLPALLAARYPGRTVAGLTALIVSTSMVALLAAGLMAAGLVGMRLLGVDFATATAAAACAMLACFIVRGVGGSEAPNGLLYPLLLLAMLVPLVILSAQWYGLPVPQLAYANSLWQLQGIEENLLEQELADPAFMKPMLTAFLSLTPVNFVGLVLGMAAGVATLPSVLSSPLGATSARNGRHTALWGLCCVVLLLTLAPALATYARQSIATLIAERTPIAELPGWIFAYGKLGLVHVCGQAATDAATVAGACAALPDAGEALRLHDMIIDQDIVALALPEIAGLDGSLMGLIAVAVIAAALVTAHGPLSMIGSALGIDRDTIADEHARTVRLATYAVAAAVIVAATTVAILRPAGIIDIATWAVVLAAVGLFPALVGALWWPRANAWGAAASMLAGVGLTVGYLVARHYFPVPFFELTSALSSGGQIGMESFTELKEAWVAADPGAAKDAAWTELSAQAQSLADWWGIEGPATILLALPAGFLALIAGSLVTPDPRRPETTP